MSEPHIADRKPKIMELEPGEYYWCACGLSKSQPWCDGSHKETEFKPFAFKVPAKTTSAICMCKHTGKKPFCDGTHARLK